MGKVMYAASISLDGFLEDETGSFDWSVPDEDVHAFWKQHERQPRSSPRTVLSSQHRLHGAQSSHAAIEAMKEQLGGSLVGCQGRDVIDCLTHHGVGVVLQGAVSTGPPVRAQLDHPKEQRHRVSLVPLGSPGGVTKVPT